ncbi:hypothetical protein [Pseudonocardia sediminis]|uniref:hypothetical protein n=1 Tax=Pseudonocardia sediminis TaxID=1397368 RepID=UPI00102952FD|nr:hypothetical protein [Pseudonocardia sediminis]
MLGNPIASMAESAFDAAMQKVWDGGVWLLKGAFTLADNVSQVDAATAMGGEGSGALWPSMVWLSAMIALGLFFYQIASVAIRGGRGMFRAVSGPIQFGIAVAITTGTVATLLTAADGLTTMFLQTGLDSANFSAVMDNPDFAARVGENPDLGDAEDNVRSMILGLAAVFGVIPAGLGFALQMIFRYAAVLLLVATIPISAAGLVADATASWFWRALRWLLAAILLKPALALVLVIGVNMMARATGVAGMLAGTAILLISVFCPMVIYRLLAFVDPGTGAGMALRSAGSGGGSSEPGSDGGTSESINTARQADAARGPGGGGESSAVGGELGGSTASPAAAGRAGAAGGGGSAAGGGAAGGGAAAGGGTAGGAAAAGGASGGAAAAGAGAVGGVAAAAVVGGYLATKAAAQAAGGYASGQMAQTGIGHPGPAPSAGPSGAQIGAAASGANASANSTPGPDGTYASGGETSPIEPTSPGGTSGGESAGPEPPSVGSGPPEVGRPEPGSTAAIESSGGSNPPPEAPPAVAGPDGAETRTTPPAPREPGSTTPPADRQQATAPPSPPSTPPGPATSPRRTDPGPGTRPDPPREERR